MAAGVFDGAAMKTTEGAQHQTLNLRETVISDDAMINYLSKEIEIMSMNMIDSRNKVSFSLWIGPFLLLGSIIVGTEKGGLGLHAPGLVAWLVMGIAALLFFGVISHVIGQVEEGAWQKCDHWRECIIRIQSGEKLDRKEYERLVLYPELKDKVSDTYRKVFAISFVLFAATVYFISQLLDFGRAAAQ
jgi:hypothetical protein